MALDICSAQRSLHKYAYVHADPIGMIDPSGLFGGMGLGGQLATIAVAGTAVGLVGGAAAGAFNMIAGVALNGHLTACDSNIMAQPIMGAQYGMAGGLYLSTPVGWFNVVVGGAAVAAKRPTSLRDLRREVDTFLASAPYSSPSLIDAKGTLQRVKPQIVDAANHAGIPPELLGSVLMYEMNQYHIGDFLLDGELFWKPEERSIGIAQLRLDNLDKAFHPQYKINCKTRQKLLNEKEAVYVLADVLSYMTKQLDAGRQSRLANWESESQSTKEWLVRHYTFGKDELDPTGQGVWKVGDGDDAWGQIFGVEKGLRVIQDEGLLD